MRYPASEKLEIIRIVEQSHLPVRRTLDKLGILPGSFYRWYDRYRSGGVEALEDKTSAPSRVWNRIPDDVRAKIVDLALDCPDMSPRELAAKFTDTRKYYVSEASVYRLLKAHDLITSPAFIVIKAADEFRDKTTAINQLWQTDFTYLKVIGWGWFYLSTSSYVSTELAGCLDDNGMDHVRGAPNHPQTQGKIERWHQTLKNRILLENYYLPGDLERAVHRFVEHYNHARYHESLGNLTPADVYFGRASKIRNMREKIKRETIQQRRLTHFKTAA